MSWYSVCPFTAIFLVMACWGNMRGRELPHCTNRYFILSPPLSHPLNRTRITRGVKGKQPLLCNPYPCYWSCCSIHSIPTPQAKRHESPGHLCWGRICTDDWKEFHHFTGHSFEREKKPHGEWKKSGDEIWLNCLF